MFCITVVGATDGWLSQYCRSGGSRARDWQYHCLQPRWLPNNNTEIHTTHTILSWPIPWGLQLTDCGLNTFQFRIKVFFVLTEKWVNVSGMVNKGCCSCNKVVQSVNSEWSDLRFFTQSIKNCYSDLFSTIFGMTQWTKQVKRCLEKVKSCRSRFRRAELL